MNEDDIKIFYWGENDTIKGIYKYFLLIDILYSNLLNGFES